MMICGKIHSICHKFYVVMVKHVLVTRKTRGKARSKFKMIPSYMKINPPQELVFIVF